MRRPRDRGSVKTEHEESAEARQPAAEAPFMLADWVVDPAANRLRRNDIEIRLEPKVMRVLSFLAEHHGQVVSRRKLEAEVWPRVIVGDDAVTNTIIKLRKALGDDARDPRYIETIAKMGYRLIAEIGPAVAESPKPRQTPASNPAPAKVYTVPEGDLAERPAAAGHVRRYWPWVLGAAATIALAGIWFILRSADLAPNERTPAPTERPVVAVLPFENLTADPQQEYFSDGITEDLITELSKLSGLQVVARNSVLPYRDNTLPESQIGAELGRATSSGAVSNGPASACGSMSA